MYEPCSQEPTGILQFLLTFGKKIEKVAQSYSPSQTPENY